jgi:anti-anti-sigma factor
MEVLSGEAAIVEIDGPLNGKTSPDFEEYINQLLERNLVYILLDASKLEFVSSEGIGVMLYIQKKITERNGFFILYNLSPEISSLYEILGFNKVFNIASSKIDALQIMDRQREMREEGEDESAGVSENGDSGSYAVSLEEDEDISVSEFHGSFFEEEEFPREEIRTDKRKEKPEVVAFEPFVVECEKCKSLIRVKQSGGYLCPTCKTELTVNSNQTVVFHE